ncbi:hypothetical protein [Rhizobium sp. BR 315]|uniref:hypothetical protein n=1 Tax=Rhizobium sp. BR 315 TaxID=3040014 RepID=UPI003D33DD52
MSSIEILIVVAGYSFRLKEPARRLERAAEHAEAAGHQVAVTMVPASPVFATTLSRLGEVLPSRWRLSPAGSDDLSASLDAAIQASRAEFLTIMDPADGVCEDWLTRCVEEAAGPATAFMPEALVTYGPNYATHGETAFIRLPTELDAGSLSEDIVALPARFVAPRPALAVHSFPRPDAARGWGAPGWNEAMHWWWVCRLLSGGVSFRQVPGSVQYRALPSGADPRCLLRLQKDVRTGPWVSR